MIDGYASVRILLSNIAQLLKQKILEMKNFHLSIKQYVFIWDLFSFQGESGFQTNVFHIRTCIKLIEK